MSKSLSGNKQGSGNVRFFPDGIMVERFTIAAVEDFSNYPLQKKTKKNLWASGKPSQICLKLVVDTGMSERKMNIFGNFDIDYDRISGKMKKYNGWSIFGNMANSLITNLGLGENALNDDDSITDEVLKKLVGLPFYKLKYCIGPQKTGNYAGKPDYKDYSEVYDGFVNDGSDILYADWLTVADKFKKKRGYKPEWWNNWNIERIAEKKAMEETAKRDGPMDNDLM